MRSRHSVAASVPQTASLKDNRDSAVMVQAKPCQSAAQLQSSVSPEQNLCAADSLHHCKGVRRAALSADLSGKITKTKPYRCRCTLQSTCRRSLPPCMASCCRNTTAVLQVIVPQYIRRRFTSPKPRNQFSLENIYHWPG